MAMLLSTPPPPLFIQKDMIWHILKQQQQKQHEECMPSTTSTTTNKNINNVNWSIIHDLLKQLPVATCCETLSKTGQNADDGMGRLLLSELLMNNPPVYIVQEALRAFPHAIQHNSGAFFTACKYSKEPDIIVMMLHHSIKLYKNNKSISTTTCTTTANITIATNTNTSQTNENKMNSDINNYGSENEECPYPWIFSAHIPLECAKLLIDTYPEGVLQRSQYCLSGYNLLDYFLMSEDMIQRRKYDQTIWNKFKLVLLATNYCNIQQNRQEAEECHGMTTSDNYDFSPIHTLLERIMSRKEFFTNKEQGHHMLWLLYQLCQTDHWVFQRKGKTTMGMMTMTSQYDEETYPLQFALSHNCYQVIGFDRSGLPIARELIKILIKSYPSAVKYQNEYDVQKKKSTLQIAIENGWPCHDLILSIYPDALNIPDPETELFPFQTAAAFSMHHHDVQQKLASSSSSSSSFYAERERIYHANHVTAASVAVPQFVCQPKGDTNSFQLGIMYELLRANPMHVQNMMTMAPKTVVNAKA